MTNQTQAHAFFQTQVLPSVRDWMASDLELHRANSVAVNLNQMVDHYWHAFVTTDPARLQGAQSVSALRKLLCASSSDLSLIRDVADSHKHFKIDRTVRNLTSANQTTVASMGWGEAKWDEGKWGSPPEVVVTFDDGSKHHFSTAVRKTIEFWESLLQ